MITKKPKMGRPRRAKKVADGTITIRVTPEERATITRFARSVGMSLSQWVRLRIVPVSPERAP